MLTAGLTVELAQQLFLFGCDSPALSLFFNSILCQAIKTLLGRIALCPSIEHYFNWSAQLGPVTRTIWDSKSPPQGILHLSRTAGPQKERPCPLLSFVSFLLCRICPRPVQGVRQHLGHHPAGRQRQVPRPETQFLSSAGHAVPQQPSSNRWTGSIGFARLPGATSVPAATGTASSFPSNASAAAAASASLSSSVEFPVGRFHSGERLPSAGRTGRLGSGPVEQLSASSSDGTSSGRPSEAFQRRRQGKQLFVGKKTTSSSTSRDDKLGRPALARPSGVPSEAHYVTVEGWVSNFPLLRARPLAAVSCSV